MWSNSIDSQVGKESALGNMSSVLKALRNPLILDPIFARLNTTDLKTARLVCPNWAEVGGNLLGKRTFLQVNQLFRYDGSNLYQVIPIPQNLMRRLTISDKFDPSVPTEKKGDVITKIFTDVAHVSQFTREIHFYVDYVIFTTAFVRMSRLNMSTTNIQHISVSAWSEESNISPFQPFLQILLDSAPNLTSLNDQSSSYPNLEGCKNLKILKFSVQNVPPSPLPNVDLVAAIEMLAQVKDSLIEMELSYTRNKINTIPQQSQKTLDFPVMSKLASLSIPPAAVYLFENYFNEDYLPALKNLFLSVNNETGALTLLRYLNLWKRHRGVQSLRLDLYPHWRVDPNAVGEQIVRLFPSVKKFELMAWFARNNSMCEVNRMMTPYRNWDLEEVSALGRGVSESSVLISVMKNLAILKGVKRVNFTYTHIKQDDLFASIQEIILRSRGFKSVTINGDEDVVPEIMEVLQPILEGSGAPIRVTGGVIPNRVGKLTP